MNPQDWEKLEALFHEALERYGAERESFLEGACPRGDPLRAELDSLLESEAPARQALNAPPARIAADLLDRQPRALAEGARLGDYEVQAQVAAGGMGEIYRARDLRRHRTVALKILRRHLTANPQAVYRFETEASAASALQHPNIVAIYEFGESADGLFIAMEWVDGITWRERFRHGIAPVAEAKDWALQAATALAAAHRAGILHRDIKPENIMLGSDGVVKVLDFGLARLSTPRPLPLPAGSGPTGASGTISGTLSGTLLYMPPEVLRGETAVSASDVYSLGAVLYELLAGVHPFAAETPLDVLEAIESRPIAPPSVRRGGISAQLDPLILEMLDRDAAARPNAAQVVERIGQ